MFEDEWPLLIGVALQADGICSPRCFPHVREIESTMLVVTACAAHSPFGDAVMKRPRKLLLDFTVASVTKVRGLFDQQILDAHRLVRRVAITARDLVHAVLRLTKVVPLFPSFVTGETASIRFARWSPLEPVNLRRVASTINMFLARPVTSFAAFLCFSVLRARDCHEMSGLGEAVVKVFMAHLAGVRADEGTFLFLLLLRFLSPRRITRDSVTKNMGNKK